MTILATKANFTGSSVTEGQFKANFDDLVDFIQETSGMAAGTTLTISVGAVTPPIANGGFNLIDTEAAASTDNLDIINTTNTPDGRLLFIRPADTTRTVVVRDNQGGTGRVLLTRGTTFSMDSTEKWMLLKLVGTSWEEVFRSYGADTTTEVSDLGLANAIKNDTTTDLTVGYTSTIETVTYGATITPNFTTQGVKELTATGNFTLNKPASGNSGVSIMRITVSNASGITLTAGTNVFLVGDTFDGLDTEVYLITVAYYAGTTNKMYAIINKVGG